MGKHHSEWDFSISEWESPLRNPRFQPAFKAQVGLELTGTVTVLKQPEA
jgi:hypothetical protein